MAVTESFESAPESLRSSAAQVSRAADEVENLAGREEFSDVTVFGADPFGTVIGKFYAEQVTPILKTLQAASVQLNGHADRYRAMADTTEQVDAELAGRVGRIDRPKEARS